MPIKQPTFSRANGWAIAAALLAIVVGVVSYGNWGYERHLAVESFPVASAAIDPEFQFSIQYRKRFNWLPGEKLTLVAVDHDDILELRGTAVTTYDWSIPDLRGTTYCFVRDYAPLPGWTKRDSMAERVPTELN